MITIEVLISMLILFMVIATSIATIKQLKIVREQQIKHDDLYMLVLNVKDYIDGEICSTKQVMEGEFDGYRYRAVCRKENELRSYVKAFEEGDVEGNTGNKLVQFYAITLNLKKKKVDRSYLYFKTIIKSL